MMTYMAEKHSESECVLLYALYCEGSFDAYFTNVFGSYFLHFIMLRLLMLHRSSK
jgi:hypothetical protein